MKQEIFHQLYKALTDKKRVLPVGAKPRYASFLYLAERLHDKKITPSDSLKLSPDENALAHRISQQLLSNWDVLLVLADQLLTKKLRPQDSAFRLLIFIVITEMLLLKTAPHAIAVIIRSLAKSVGEYGRTAVLQAVVKKIERESITMPTSAPPLPAIKNHQDYYGEVAVAEMVKLYRQPAPLDIICESAETAQNLLSDDKLKKYSPIALPFDNMVRFIKSPPIKEIAPIENGTAWVQDIAATIPVRLLLAQDVAGKKSVADLCAAPGGKTKQLASAGMKTLAVEQSGYRASLLADNLSHVREKYNIQIMLGDILTMHPLPQPYVLLDAPCSATGTGRKNPDVFIKKNQKDIIKNSATQKKMLYAAWQWLMAGGVLAYAVCSLEPEEGEAVITEFLQKEKSAKLIKIEKNSLLDFLPDDAFRHGFLRTLPHYLEQGMDGFFVALLRKI